MREINDYFRILEPGYDPLSADVYFIKGKEYTYIVDVGSNDTAFRLIDGIDKKKIIITHFHADHMKNMERIDVTDECLFVGDYSYKVLGRGTLVQNNIEIDDGVKIRIVPLPNSHAKGALCVMVNDEYLVLGDSFYCSKRGYNVSLLHDEIAVLEEFSFSKVLLSHDEKIYAREEILSELKYIYKNREKGNPYISI
ncbi:MBL fold metallo-hydrolase [Butyrivibrio sp. YAB3001]|uniref:MBL fold metallo-hydrolase n=1 Tax=Butyrivibrio sp. YAB3001 TaxID=1520812 RepID=UPI0008F65276|nr:MBL fold metallo-hydrolase [Butyrivibrio sp. YAB3001]SFC43745.1 Glyoxylase, beta-lactamase superfamily II [Butyrivibrio sp. YAB3001]